jgi:hypothetical protein
MGRTVISYVSGSESRGNGERGPHCHAPAEDSMPLFYCEGCGGLHCGGNGDDGEGYIASYHIISSIPLDIIHNGVAPMA